MATRVCMDCGGRVHAAFSFVLAGDVLDLMQGTRIEFPRERCDWCAAWASMFGGCACGVSYLWGEAAAEEVMSRRRAFCEKQMKRAGK